jgi:tetratricopeptide (TPR) repeat protein
MGISEAKKSNLQSSSQYFYRALEQVLAEDPTLVISSFPSQSESPSTCQTQTRSASVIQRREYDEGMNSYSSFVHLLSLHADRLGVSTVRLGVSTVACALVYNIGQVRFRQGHFAEAYNCFLDVFPLSQRIHQESTHPLAIQALHNIGYIQFITGDIDMSIKTFNEALRLCLPASSIAFRKESSNDSHSLLASTLNCLGVLYFHLPKTDSMKSLSYLTRALLIQRTLFTEPRRNTATTLNNIGRIHFIERRYEQAMACYREALALRRTLLGRDHIDVTATTYNIGRTLQEMGNLKLALTHYQEFIRITLPRLGFFNCDLFSALKCVACHCYEQGRKEQVLGMCEEAVLSRNEYLGIHREVASVLNKMGKIHYDNGEFEASISMYCLDLQVKLTVLDRGHPNVTTTLTNIGHICNHLGEFSSALQVFQQVLAIQMDYIGPHDPRVASTLSNIGQIYFQTNEYGASVEFYQQALRIRRDTLGESCLDVASSLNSIGRVLFDARVIDRALTSFLESLQIRRALLGAEHHDVAIVKYNIATVLLELGRDDEALPYYRETLRIERIALGSKHMDLVLILHCLAQVHEQRRELREALECYLELLDIKRYNLRQDDRTVATTLNRMANLCLQLGNASEAVALISEATRVARKCGNVDAAIELSDFHLYSFAKLLPEGAAAA